MVIVMATLVAQLMAPNTQPGPLRLPAKTPQGPSVPNADRGNLKLDQDLELSDQPQQNKKGEKTPSSSGQAQQISIKGELPYSPDELKEILGSCTTELDTQARLTQCAASLTTRLITDGYINSRVLITSTPNDEHLEIIEGRILEIQVNGESESLNKAVYEELVELKSRALNIFDLDQKLATIRQTRLIQRLQARLKRLGSQISETALIVNVEPRPFPWQGFLEASNDGSGGTGDLRAVGAVSKENILKDRDTLLLFSEISGNSDPDLGSFMGSVSYRYPITSSLDLTLAGGYSHRRLIDLPNKDTLISYRMKQGSMQLDWNILQSQQQIWSIFGSFSGDQSRLLINGEQIGKETSLNSIQRKPRSAFARFGITGLGAGPKHRWMTTLYAIQGLAASVPDRQRELRRLEGVDVGKAQALGGQANLKWDLTDTLMFEANVAGQLALHPLMPSMGFVVGADQGLVGLPSQWISGDSGWLAVAELPWKFAEGRQGTFQLVPYLGGGGVETEINQIEDSNSVISYGLFVRYQNKEENFNFDFGFTGNTTQRPQTSDSLLLDQGLYIKTRYYF